MMEAFQWPARDEFVNRRADLDRLQGWWEGVDRSAIAMFGRRRVGKSWLLRAFAHDRPSLLLVADQGSPSRQLSRFADALEPHLGLRPELPDLRALFKALYKLASDQRILVAIDEFPYLLPGTQRSRREVLSEIQATMEEEREHSQLKLILCGSHITQMQTLLSESSPLRGRLQPLRIEPLSFGEADHFLPGNAADRVERYAVAGGMAMYLTELSRHRRLRDALCESALDRRGPLFNDPREVLEQEFRRPGVYFSLLELLAGGARALHTLTKTLQMPHSALLPYLNELTRMQLVESVEPLGSKRDRRYRLRDDYLRFWFRFVFPFQQSLQAGLDPRDHFEAEIAPALAEHVAPTYEELCRHWVRHNMGKEASTVGPWWGRALDRLRADGTRSVEEIDVVATVRSRVTVVGECKWNNAPMRLRTLEQLERFKLPALRQTGARFAAKGPSLLLFSRSGFDRDLGAAAETRSDLRLIALDELDNGLVD